MNKYMIAVSFLALFSFLTAIYLRKYYASIPAISVFITSILFWSKPEEKWRMYIDIVVVQLALYYSIFYAYYNMDLHKFRRYFTVLAVSLIYFAFAILSWNLNPYINHTNISFFKTVTIMLHSMATFITNCSNIIMYTSITSI